MKASYLAIFGALGFVLLSGVERTAQAAPGAPEYVVIQWDGERKTQVIWSDGHVEFLNTLLPGVTKPSDDVHERGYIMTLLVNKLAKQGYEYVGMTSGEEILMKKVR